MGGSTGGTLPLRLGINGLGRIGKLTLWHHLARGDFGEIVVNIGRPVGQGLSDIAHYVERDSTYGKLHTFLHGHNAPPVIVDLDEKENSLVANGVKVRFLLEERNPVNIPWGEEGVKLVVDCTGQFRDPTTPPDHPKGSALGHLEAGAHHVVVSAPFKLKDREMPDYALTTVMGINHHLFDRRKHLVVSNASCTTTCLGHMMKPLMDHLGTDRILAASMATVHAATGSQAVLDRLPAAGTSDLRKNRSLMQNIILTTTGAADALALVMPEIKRIGFTAESVRIPVNTGSLIILVVSLQDHRWGGPTGRDEINRIYADTARADKNGYLIYSEDQNTSRDIVGSPRAAAIIEASETHTRTADMGINLVRALGERSELIGHLYDEIIKVPVTQAVIFAWYDNELASYVNLLGDRVVTMAEKMLEGEK